VTTRRHFTKAIEASPHDADLRLVFADWLEETGHTVEADGQRLLAAVLKEPYDTRARWHYATWLDDHRREREARLHQWIVLLLLGEDLPDMVISRRGVEQVDDGDGEFQTERPLPAEARRTLESRARELFAAHPDVYLVVVGRTDPSAQELEEDDRPAGASGEVRSPVLYLWYGPGSVHRIATAPEFEVGSLCPFCAWDAQDTDWQGCKHLVFALSDWNDDPDGLADVQGGIFQKAAHTSLGKLAGALRRFVRACGADRKRLDSLTPKRLRLLAKGLVKEAGLCDDPEEVESWMEQAHVPKDAFQDYLCSLFCLIEKEGRTTSFDTGDHWGTSAYLFWAPNAKETAKQIVRQVSEDVGTLRLAAK
jgi:uncharacterized protein (TIGR02996 family)